jgi:hypothetical protein
MEQQIMAGLVVAVAALEQQVNQQVHQAGMRLLEMVAPDWPQVSLASKFSTVAVAVVA